MRSFLGLVGYNKDHIPTFAEISAPLFDLLKKGKSEQVQWNEAQERAYSLTYRKPLKYLKDAAYQNDHVFRWAIEVQVEYSFRVEDFQSKENIGADFWSQTGYSCG